MSSESRHHHPSNANKVESLRWITRSELKSYSSNISKSKQFNLLVTLVKEVMVDKARWMLYDNPPFDLNQPISYQPPRSYYGSQSLNHNTITHLAPLISFAASRNSISLVNLLIKFGADPFVFDEKSSQLNPMSPLLETLHAEAPSCVLRVLFNAIDESELNFLKKSAYESERILTIASQKKSSMDLDVLLNSGFNLFQFKQLSKEVFEKWPELYCEHEKKFLTQSLAQPKNASTIRVRL